MDLTTENPEVEVLVVEAPAAQGEPEAAKETAAASRSVSPGSAREEPTGVPLSDSAPRAMANLRIESEGSGTEEEEAPMETEAGPVRTSTPSQGGLVAEEDSVPVHDHPLDEAGLAPDHSSQEVGVQEDAEVEERDVEGPLSADEDALLDDGGDDRSLYSPTHTC